MGPAYFKIQNPIAFLDYVKECADISQEWHVQNRNLIGGDHGLAVCFDSEDGTSRNLGFVLFYFEHDPGELQLTISASSWGDGRPFPTSVEYGFEEGRVWKFLCTAAKNIGFRIRLTHREKKPNPLRGKLKKCFDCFVLNVTDTWTGERKNYIDIRDEMIWHEFVRLAHRCSSVLSPEDLKFHLRKTGISGEIIDEIIHQYEIGRRVLSKNLYPWEERRRRREARKYRHDCDIRDLAKIRAAIGN